MIVECPCCGEKLIISFGNEDEALAFLFEKISITPEELSLKYNIELG